MELKSFPKELNCMNKKSADLWLSWGEVQTSNMSIISATNLKLIGRKVTKKNYNNPVLLQITDDLFPYSRFPWCSDEFNKIYMDEQVRFASLLSGNIQKKSCCAFAF